MGNRATIEFKNNSHLGIYLHWNGGRDSIEAFLAYAKLKHLRGYDCGYAHARLCQIIGNFMGGTLSIGTIAGKEDIESWRGQDKGVYVIDENFDIVDRIYPYDDFVEQYNYDLEGFLIAIDKSQPEQDQLDLENYLSAEEVSINDLNIGDRVYCFDNINHVNRECVVLGFGEEGDRINGRDVSGIPFTDRLRFKYDFNSEKFIYDKSKTIEDLKDNCNSYIDDIKVRRCFNIKLDKKENTKDVLEKSVDSAARSENHSPTKQQIR